MIYLPVQSYALCPVLSGVILSFNTKSHYAPRYANSSSHSSHYHTFFLFRLKPKWFKNGRTKVFIATLFSSE